MIRSLKILDPKNTHISWWEKVEALNKPQTFKFKPGINVLWGKNGSGKTTIIKALARLTHCEQSGNPVVTQTSIRNLFDRWMFGKASVGGASILKRSVRLSHDGQGVRCFDPGNAVGLYGGSFDYDFTEAGISNTLFKGSSGQTTSVRIDALLGEVITGSVPEVERRIYADQVNSVWSEKIKLADSFLKGSGKKGQPTILLDEPARSLDLPTQVQLWRFVRAYAEQVQFIVASHSMYAMDIPGANYIELTEGYMDDSLRCLAALFGWRGIECKPVSLEIVAKIKAGKG